MNLVQINERLKDLPMQVVQQYANGMNPEVPPYLALGELQRREMAQKQMATAQGAAQGPQPSIKEQVEQKAGLMQLQQMQQQQMAQQQAQPQGPMPVPAGAPQPQMQPEAPQAMMARGGLAGVPMRRDMFEYAGGGIIAFQAGGDTMGTPSPEQQELTSQAAAITDEMVAERRNKAKMIEELEKKLVFLTNAGAPQAKEVRAQLDQLKASEAPRRPPAPPAVRQAPPPQAGARPESGLPTALSKVSSAAAPATGAQPPAAPRPAPTGLPGALPPVMQAGAPEPAAIPVSPDRAELSALMKSYERKEPTAQGIIGDVNALLPTGLKEEARQQMIADQRARAEERKATFEKTRPSGLDDLIRVFGQAGQYKGLSGMGPAYTSNQDRKRAQELAFQKEQDELLTAIDTRSTAADERLFTARTGAMDKAQTLFGQSQKSILEAAAAKLGAEQGRLDKQSQLNMQLDLKKFETAQEERLKGMDIEQRERERKTTAANNPAARAAQYVALKQQARDLRASGETAKADRLDAQASDMLAFSGGGSGAGDRNPTPTDRLRAAQSILTDIDSTPEEKTAAKKEIANIMAGGKPGGDGKGAGAPLPPDASAKNLVVGTVYQTAKGPAKWTGTGFMPI
jgi:hypothetical protein